MLVYWCEIANKLGVKSQIKGGRVFIGSFFNDADMCRS